MKFVTKMILYSIASSYISYIISYFSYMAYTVYCTVQYSECHKGGWGKRGRGSIFGRKEAILENYIHTIFSN
jgi:hypothetical protein